MTEADESNILNLPAAIPNGSLSKPVVLCAGGNGVVLASHGDAGWMIDPQMMAGVKIRLSNGQLAEILGEADMPSSCISVGVPDVYYRPISLRPPEGGHFYDSLSGFFTPIPSTTGGVTVRIQRSKQHADTEKLKFSFLGEFLENFAFSDFRVGEKYDFRLIRPRISTQDKNYRQLIRAAECIKSCFIEHSANSSVHKLSFEYISADSCADYPDDLEVEDFFSGKS